MNRAKKAAVWAVNAVFFFLAVLLLLALIRTAAAAEKLDFEETVSKSAVFSMGFFTGFVAHEYGHQVMADAAGVRMRWDLPANPYDWRWTAETSRKRDLKNLAVGGFASQAFATEVLLSSREREKNAFTAGWVAFNIFNALAYVGKHRLGGSRGYGDLALYRSAGGNDKALSAFLVGHTLFSAYRLVSNSPPFFEVKIDGDRLLVVKRFRLD